MGNVEMLATVSAAKGLRYVRIHVPMPQKLRKDNSHSYNYVEGRRSSSRSYRSSYGSNLPRQACMQDRFR